MNTINVTAMFPRAETTFPEGTSAWSAQLFERAYLGAHGPFSKVVRRLSSGFSVLVYLPGNCMKAAADKVKQEISSFSWQEYLDEVPDGQSLVTLWQHALSAFQNLRKAHSPGSIFHNLDFLSDSRGGTVYPHPDAQGTVFTLIDAVRNGVVLGLSDRDEPELPASIARAFTDKIRIDEVPHDNFHRIIPAELGEKLYEWSALNEGAISLLASRLRWTDPIRVYRILRNALKGAADFEGLLREVLSFTQTVNFLTPQEAFGEVDHAAGGFRKEMIAFLRDNIIVPFQTWQKFRGTRQECMRLLDKLPPGAILYGPPGTGKTYLARWMAHEIDLPIRIVSGGDLRSSDWGQAERNVRALFRDARRASPCVLVLDDADDLIPDRAAASGSVAAAERAVVNEFLQQMQGVRGQLEGVLVILTTNRFESLDAAAKARLPLHVRVSYPADKDAVGQIVDRIASDYGFELVAVVREELIELFSQPITPQAVDPLKADDNYFSPREIRQAMRMLEPWHNINDRSKLYKPRMQEVARVALHYKSHWTPAHEISMQAVQ